MSDPLERVVEVFARRESEALSKLGEARLQTQRAEADLQRIEQLGTEYRQQLDARGSSGIDAAALKHWRGFIGHLDVGAHRQQANVHRTRQHAAHAERAWREARIEADGMAKVHARRLTAEALRHGRREQRQQDEMAGLAARRADAARAEEGG